MIINGDALRVALDLDDAIADAVITDPPYNSGGTTPSERRRQTARQKYTTGRAGQLAHELETFDGDQRDQRGYLAWLTLILTEAHRITIPGGSLLVATDWRQLPVTSDAVQAAGWVWSGMVVWAKPRHRSRPMKGGFWRQCEFYVWGVRGKLRTDHDVYLPGIVEAAAPGAAERQHPTEKPIALMRQLVRIAPPGGLIVDLCAGSGTTGKASLETGRRFLGVELSAHYAEVARRRIDAIQPQLTD